MDTMNNRRSIVHVDMDAFFASIEQRDNPEYRRKPVVVGSDPKAGSGRGVVSTCSYEARKFGIHSAMPISIAFRKCPQAIFLPVDMEKYQQVSRDIYSVFYSFTPDVEPVSIDEGFLDITGSHHLFGGELETCIKIKAKILKETALTASVGLAPTKMAAKIASDLDKPDGLVVVSEKDLLSFLWPLDIRKLWGLGKKAEAVLQATGIRTIGDIANMDPRELVAIFGNTGRHFWDLAHGIDGRVVEPAAEAKSISNEITFDEDTSDEKMIQRALMSLCESVSARMRNEGLRCRTITLKIRLEGFKTYTRSVSISHVTNYVDSLYKEIKALYNNFDTERKRVRLVGVKATNLSYRKDRTLFSEDEECRQESVHMAIDKIKNKFGSDSIYHATAARSNRRTGDNYEKK